MSTPPERDRLRTLASLKGLPIMSDGHLLGTCGEPILDNAGQTLLGLEVEAVSGRRYFLPSALCTIGQSWVRVSSPLHLVDDVAYYRRHGRPLSSVSGEPLLDPSGGIVQRVGD